MTEFSYHIPFENLDLYCKSTLPITKENLINKILVRGEGGMCYHLNTLMYFFLKDSGFKVHQSNGTVQLDKDFWYNRNGHITTILIHDQQEYLIEVGFSSLQPQAPIKINGEILDTSTRFFRVREDNSTEFGKLVFEVNRSTVIDENSVWEIGFAYSPNIISDIEVNLAQNEVVNDPKEIFVKDALVCKLLKPYSLEGHVSLTTSCLTFTKPNGERIKNQITTIDEFKKELHSIFGLQLK
eukprot:gene8063-9919_t